MWVDMRPCADQGLLLLPTRRRPPRTPVSCRGHSLSPLLWSCLPPSSPSASCPLGTTSGDGGDDVLAASGSAAAAAGAAAAAVATSAVAAAGLGCGCASACCCSGLAASAEPLVEGCEASVGRPSQCGGGQRVAARGASSSSNACKSWLRACARGPRRHCFSPPPPTDGASAVRRAVQPLPLCPAGRSGMLFSPGRRVGAY